MVHDTLKGAYDDGSWQKAAEVKERLTGALQVATSLYNFV
jgi:hypothetical protein